VHFTARIVRFQPPVKMPRLEDGVCIPFAAGDKTRWWEPDAGSVYFWPIPKREYTVDCLNEAFESLGYKKCKCSLKKRGFEKVAIYHDPVGFVEGVYDFGIWHPEVLPKSPTHAAT
jgi:hypothetical protein